MDIKLKSHVFNTLEDGTKFHIIPLTKKQYDEIIRDYNGVNNSYTSNKFLDKYGFKHTQMILDGESYIDPHDKETLESINDLLARMLPAPTKAINPDTMQTGSSYKCFCAKPLNIPDLISHRTPLDSWKCLMIRLGEPEYAIVIEEKPKKS